VTEPTVAAPRPLAHAALTAFYGLLILLAWVGLELWGIGWQAFHTKGEPREGLVVWEMTHGGGWILPRRNGVELPSKPPLFHWLAAATALGRGATDEWSMRFPSVALSLVGLLCVFATGAALWTPRAGLISALGLMTMFEWARAATNARVDMTLTLGLQIAFLSVLFFLRSRAAVWLLPLYLGIAWAVLGKGPVGVALPALVALAMFIVTRDFTALPRLRLGAGALAVVVIAGSWYAMAVILGGAAFFHKQVLAENVFTLLYNAKYRPGHQHGVGYLIGAWLLGVLPWTLFLPAVGVRLWRERRTLSAGDARVYLLVWIAVVLAFYGIAAAKRSVYLLALYPAIALLLGWWWDAQDRSATPWDPWQLRILIGLCWAATCVVVLLLLVTLLEALGVPLLGSIHGWFGKSAQLFLPWVSELMRGGRALLVGPLLIAAVALWACRRAAQRGEWIRVFASLWLAVAALLIAVRLAILPVISEHQSLRGFMGRVREIVGPNETLSFYKAFDYQAVFYWNGHIPAFDGDLSAGAPRYALTTSRQWEHLPAPVREQYEEVVRADNRAPSDPNRLVLIRRVGTL